MKKGTIIMRTAKNFAKFVKKIFPKAKYVKYCDTTIPPPDKRCCGPEFKDARFYLKSAEAEATRLVNHFRCNNKSRILNIGFGQGRLPIGILRVIGEIDYIGIDVHSESIAWCKRYIGQKHRSFRFNYLDVYNERYNRNGSRLDK